MDDAKTEFVTNFIYRKNFFPRTSQGVSQAQIMSLLMSRRVRHSFKIRIHVILWSKDIFAVLGNKLLRDRFKVTLFNHNRNFTNIYFCTNTFP